MTTGAWIDAAIPGMKYRVLLPAGYDPAASYPAVIYLHELGRGTDPADLNNEINAWFNPGAVRDAHPCFVIVPLLDQTADRSGVTVNFGGVSQSVTNGRDWVLAVIARATGDYPAIDKARLLLTGSSLGGLGTWELICYRPDLFAAAMPLAGAHYWRDPGVMAAALHDKPIWAIHGASDTSVPLAWDRAFAAATKAIGGVAKYSEDPTRGHDVWDYWYPRADLWAWAFAQRLGSPVTQPVTKLPASRDNTAIVAGGGAITDALGNTWTLTAAGQVACNGAADTTTRNVTMLAWAGGVLWQCNQAGRWYPWSGSAWGAGTAINPITGQGPAPAAAAFRVTGGQIIGPGGTPFIAAGINLNNETQLAQVATGPDCKPLLGWFPGLNMIRVANRSYRDPSYYALVVGYLTARNIVVEFEDHTGISAPPYSGAQLATETAWYAKMAQAFANNPYVWFGGFNEPGNGSNLAAIWTQSQAIYAAIRGASSAIYMISLPSGGNRTLVGPQARGYDGRGPMCDANGMKSLTNVVIDLHNYGYLSNFSTDPAMIKTWLMGTPPAPAATGVAAAQGWQSADGQIPVIIGEFGDSTDGKTIDTNGAELCQVVGASGLGFLAWALHSDYAGDQLVTTAGALTGYGKLIAQLIAAATTPAVIQPGTTPAIRFSAPFGSLTSITPNGGPMAWMCGLGYGGEARRTLKWNTEGEYYWDIGGGYGAYSVAPNGGLIITADKASIANPMGLPYNSGALSSCVVSNDQPGAGILSAFTYGYAEMTGLLPAGRGLFPAFWWEPLADGDGEVDGAEALGHDLTSIYCTVHYSATDSAQIQALDPSATAVSARQVKVTVSDYSKTAHRYGFDKQPDFITWYVDRKPVCRIPTPEAAKRPGYLLVNLAVGQAGSWPGAPDASTVFPARLGPFTIDVWPSVAASGVQDLAPVIAQVGAIQTNIDAISARFDEDLAALKTALTKLQNAS